MAKYETYLKYFKDNKIGSKLLLYLSNLSSNYVNLVYMLIHECHPTVTLATEFAIRFEIDFSRKLCTLPISDKCTVLIENVESFKF